MLPALPPPLAAASLRRALARLAAAAAPSPADLAEGCAGWADARAVAAVGLLAVEAAAGALEVDLDAYR
jgi:hypothetical protein